MRVDSELWWKLIGKVHVYFFVSALLKCLTVLMLNIFPVDISYVTVLSFMMDQNQEMTLTTFLNFISYIKREFLKCSKWKEKHLNIV